METDLRLPYFKDTGDLPAPLPTWDDIQASTRILAGAEELTSRKVVVVGCHFLVKYGSSVSLTEGENLLFLERNLPQIPAPRLYAMWQQPGVDGELFIVMELLAGNTLESLWPVLSESDKTLVLGKLRSNFDLLRSLPSPGFYGSVVKGCLPHYLFRASEKDPAITGPFKDGRSLILGLAKKSRQNWAHNGKRCHLPDFFENNLAPALGEHQPVFTHSDVQRKNIIVQEVTSLNSTQSKDFDVSIVDWEDAGWYPSYWEYVAAFFVFICDEDDWPKRVEEFVRPWGPEAAMMRMIYQDLLF